MRLMSSLCAGRVRSSALSKNSTPLRGMHREYFIYLTLSFLKWLGGLKVANLFLIKYYFEYIDEYPWPNKPRLLEI